jgi:hypothetical protein
VGLKSDVDGTPKGHSRLKMAQITDKQESWVSYFIRGFWLLIIDFNSIHCESIPSHEMGRWWVRRYQIQRSL